MNDDDVRALQVLKQILDKVDSAASRRGSSLIQPGSRTAIDDEVTAPYLLSNAVATALTCALDHLLTLRSLVLTANVLHPVAPMTLLRGALENAALAVWLLEPEDAPTRVLRCVQLHVQDKRDEAEVERARQVPDDQAGDLDLQGLVDIATRSGLRKDQVVGKAPGWRTIVSAAGAAASFPEALFVWQSCSGFMHGRSWAVHGLSKRNYGVDQVDDLYRVEASPVVVAGAAIAADRMFSCALHLHDRHRLAWRQSDKEVPRSGS